MKDDIKNPGLKDLDLSDKQDADYNGLVEEILDFYGYPYSATSCISKEEKIMWVYGIFAVKYALSSCKNLWQPFYKITPSEELAPIVCRKFFEEFKHHLIPSEDDMKDPAVVGSLKKGSIIRLKDDESGTTGELELSGSKTDT